MSEETQPTQEEVIENLIQEQKEWQNEFRQYLEDNFWDLLA